MLAGGQEVVVRGEGMMVVLAAGWDQREIWPCYCQLGWLWEELWTRGAGSHQMWTGPGIALPQAPATARRACCQYLDFSQAKPLVDLCPTEL